MRAFFEDLKTALLEIATDFLFLIPIRCKKEKEVSKKISRK